MPKFFLFDIRLRGVENPPWRQFLLRSTVTFQKLHEAIQDACRWEDYHLFRFRHVDLGPRGIAGSPHDDEGEEPDASRVKLSSVFKSADLRVIYEYDFGDGWEIDVTLKEIVEDVRRSERWLVDGDFAFPPEDCGGISGYLECIRVSTTAADLADSDPLGEVASAQRARDPEIKDWLGSWIPTRFHLGAAQSRFHR